MRCAWSNFAKAFLATQLTNGAFAPEANQDNADLLLGGELATGVALDVADHTTGTTTVL